MPYSQLRFVNPGGSQTYRVNERPGVWRLNNGAGTYSFYPTGSDIVPRDDEIEDGLCFASESRATRVNDATALQQARQLAAEDEARQLVVDQTHQMEAGLTTPSYEIEELLAVPPLTLDEMSSMAPVPTTPHRPATLTTGRPTFISTPRRAEPAHGLYSLGNGNYTSFSEREEEDNNIMPPRTNSRPAGRDARDPTAVWDTLILHPNGARSDPHINPDAVGVEIEVEFSDADFIRMYTNADSKEERGDMLTEVGATLPTREKDLDAVYVDSGGDGWLVPSIMGLNVKNDGSLRGINAEYITKPVSYNKAMGIISKLFGLIDPIIKHDSSRTSIHVHVNQQGKTLKELVANMVAYWLIEDHLIKFVAPKRGNHLYCRTAEASASSISDFASWMMRYRGNIQGERYLGMNYQSLQRFGTLEFRLFPGQYAIKPLRSWVAFLANMSIITTDKKISPSDLYDLLWNDDIEGFLDCIMTETCPYRKRIIEGYDRSLVPFDELHALVHSITDWDAAAPVVIKAEPVDAAILSKYDLKPLDPTSTSDLGGMTPAMVAASIGDRRRRINTVATATEGEG